VFLFTLYADVCTNSDCSAVQMSQNVCCIMFMLCHRYESAAAGFKVYLHGYLSPELAAADNSRESSPLRTSSTRTAKVMLLHKSQEPSAHDASVISYIVRQVSFELILNLS